MKHMRNGFTLVEVMLFLGVSGLLLIGVLAMTQTSISQQRFNDATQSFVEFIRSVYSEVMNPQSIGNGRSEQAIYGKLITFGDSHDLAGNKLDRGEKFFVYDVIGKAADSWRGGDATAVENWIKNGGVEISVGSGAEYIPKWGAKVKKSTNTNSNFVGVILILRRPQNGMVNTFVNNTRAMAVNSKGETLEEFLKENGGGFKMAEVDFCISMGEDSASRDVRIVKDAKNTSGVELIDLDSEDNKCNK